MVGYENIKFEYSLLSMKTLEINENSQRNQGSVSTKLLISLLVIVKEYKPWYQINDKTLFYFTILSNMQIKVI